tara:strand:+ start:1072 stop:1383 length:312 start_codon:yes stop_codon:yes gene_type:complete
MKLLTKDIKKKLSKTPIGSTAEKNAEDIPIIVKFFGGGSYSAYVYEGDELDGDWRFMAYVTYMEKEIGTVLLSELENAKWGPYGFPTERDLYLGKRTLSEVMQ